MEENDHGVGHFQPWIVGDDRLIQITPQLHILVAIEAIDGRKGIDSLAQLCREKLNADPFSGYLFIFRSRSAKSAVSRQAITKHLRVLSDAGLVRSSRRGRERVWDLETKRLADAHAYLDRISAQWDAALARLKAFVEG